jgi:hypothetical protein
MHAVSLTPHAQKFCRTTSKSENHMQNSDGMQKIKNACGVDDTACTVLPCMRACRGYLTNYFRACGVLDTACTIFAFENRSYLGEFEAEFKKALARESWTQGKKPRVENLVTLSL